MMIIEDLRGREFVHSKDESIVYTVGEGKHDRTVINWEDSANGVANSVTYRDSQVEDFFERGIWILL